MPQYFEESAANAVGVLQDLVVPKPNHADTPSFQPTGTRPISRRVRRVLAAVDFHRQPPLGTQEIDDKGSE